jgi:DNA-binding transcriptional ArsR family regulator
MLGKRRSSLTRHLKLLRDANIIEFVGSDKTGGYYLTKQAKERL